MLGWTDQRHDAPVDSSNTSLLIHRGEHHVDDVTGFVGIGTTTPGALLSVLGDIRVQSKITSSAGGLTLSGGGSGVRVELDEDGGSSDFFTISDTGVERFRVEGNTGNVGIGESFPSAKLDVVGTTELNGHVTINGALEVTDSPVRLRSYCKTLYMTFNREPISHDRSVPQRVGETPRNSCRFARSTVAIDDGG